MVPAVNTDQNMALDVGYLHVVSKEGSYVGFVSHHFDSHGLAYLTVETTGSLRREGVVATLLPGASQDYHDLRVTIRGSRSSDYRNHRVPNRTGCLSVSYRYNATRYVRLYIMPTTESTFPCRPPTQCEIYVDVHVQPSLLFSNRAYPINGRWVLDADGSLAFHLPEGGSVLSPMSGEHALTRQQMHGAFVDSFTTPASGRSPL